MGYIEFWRLPFPLLIFHLLWTILMFSGKTHPMPDISTYIIAGTLVPRGKYPFTVSLQTTDHFCGGAILNEDSILTAAHCLEEEDADDITVYIGNVNISELDDRYTYQAKRLIMHSKYNPEVVIDGYDIGIIKLKDKIHFSKYIGKVCLPEGSHDPPDLADDCRVIGWGRNEKNQRQYQLHEAPLRIQPKSVCQKTFQEYNADRIYCATDLKGRGRSCRGDSGGPIICRPRTGHSNWVQYGVVSFGGTECSSSPSFFTAVEDYTSWIQKHV